MRLDKFLKVSRLAKRRTEAHDALTAGRITRPDDRPFKPGHEVRVGDVLVVRYTRTTLTVRVLQVPERILPGLRGETLYEVLSEERTELSTT